MMAVSGGRLLILCFRANLARKLLRLMSFRGWEGSLIASWSSMRAFATSAQHRKKRSFSDARLLSFFRTVAVIVVVAILDGALGDSFPERYCDRPRNRFSFRESGLVEALPAKTQKFFGGVNSDIGIHPCNVNSNISHLWRHTRDFLLAEAGGFQHSALNIGNIRPS